MSDLLPPLVYRCNRIECAVETFKGIALMPFNCCPSCHQLGVPQ